MFVREWRSNQRRWWKMATARSNILWICCQTLCFIDRCSKDKMQSVSRAIDWCVETQKLVNICIILRGGYKVGGMKTRLSFEWRWAMKRESCKQPPCSIRWSWLTADDRAGSVSPKKKQKKGVGSRTPDPIKSMTETLKPLFFFAIFSVHKQEKMFLFIFLFKRNDGRWWTDKCQVKPATLDQRETSPVHRRWWSWPIKSLHIPLQSGISRQRPPPPTSYLLFLRRPRYIVFCDRIFSNLCII